MPSCIFLKSVAVHGMADACTVFVGSRIREGGVTCLYIHTRTCAHIPQDISCILAFLCHKCTNVK